MPERRRGSVVGLACLLLLRSGSVMAGPPFVTDDPSPVDYQHWEINIALLGTVVREGWTAGVPSIDANYGIAPGVQLHLQPQFTVESSASGKQAGIGDTQFGAKIRLVAEDTDGWRPMVAVYPIFTAPTGNAARGLGAGTGRTFLPVWVDKTVSRWIIDGGIGFSVDRGPRARNAWFVGALALCQVTETLQLGGEVFQQTTQQYGIPSATGFNVGGTYALTEHYNLLFSAGRGLVNASSTNGFSAYLALQLEL